MPWFDDDLHEKSELMNFFNAYRYTLGKKVIVDITDPEGVIVYVNELFCKYSGYTYDELIGQTHAILKSGVHDKTFYDEMWQTISRGDLWEGEICNKNKQGVFHWFEMSILPVIDKGDQIINYMSMRHPIDQRKKSEADREDYLNSLEYFLWGTSHEIRAPIASILGLLPLYKEPEKLSEDERTFIYESLLRMARKMDEITHTFTDKLSRLKESISKE